MVGVPAHLRYDRAQRYFSKQDTDDAIESDFVKAVVMPFDAEDRDEALKLIKEKLIQEGKL